jgi:GMP synthase (glutamine-hydrolysing)
VVVGDHGVGDGDPGWVGERLEQLGAELVPVDREDLPAYADLGDVDLLLLLGSDRSVRADPEAETVTAEAGLLRGAVDHDVPVLGICYGAQLAAHALGGEVTAATTPEIGWYDLESADPVLCPPGPWAQYHLDAFVPPPGAQVLGRSPGAGGVQGFTLDRVLGWQFHPEVTPATLSRWLDAAPGEVAAAGADPAAVRAYAQHHAERTRQAAHALTDAALAYLRVRCAPAAAHT